MNESGLDATQANLARLQSCHPNGLPPAWQVFVCFCQELGYGEIERLKIQDGLPVLAEVTRKKVKFGS